MPFKPTTDRPTSLLLIGNSFFYYNNGLIHHLNGLLAVDDPAFVLRSVMVTMSGSSLDWHDVKSYFRPNALSRYSFDQDNTVVFNTFDRLFDVAMLMDSSQGPIHPELAPVFERTLAAHVATIREHGTEPVLFMSWAYKDRPEMTTALATAYANAGARHEVRVIPAGLAFARAARLRPKLDLYDPDKRHPSLPGTYLATAVTYAVLFGTPVGNAYAAGLDKETARFLQAIAWEVVGDFNGRRG